MDQKLMKSAFSCCCEKGSYHCRILKQKAEICRLQLFCFALVNWSSVVGGLLEERHGPLGKKREQKYAVKSSVT